jgi:hypothetical protein
MVMYYKSYYLKDFNIVDIEYVKQMKFGYRVFYKDGLNCKIGEVLNSKMDVSKVIYYTNNIDNVLEFHKSNYHENVQISLGEELANGIKISHYNEASIALYQIDIYYEDGKPKFRQEFNENFELVEYCQSIYNETGNLIQEKIFFTDSWMIHTEKILQ